MLWCDNLNCNELKKLCPTIFNTKFILFDDSYLKEMYIFIGKKRLFKKRLLQNKL